MSSAYKITKHPFCESHIYQYRLDREQTKNGDSTEACLTPKSIPKTLDHTLSRLTQEKQPASIFCRNSNKLSGIVSSRVSCTVYVDSPYRNPVQTRPRSDAPGHLPLVVKRPYVKRLLRSSAPTRY